MHERADGAVFTHSPLGRIPIEWDVSVLGELLAGVIDFRGRTPLKLGSSWGGGDILALSANNVTMGSIDTSKEAYFGSEDLYRRWMTHGNCEMGDVLITMEAPLGNIAVVPDNRKYILSQRVVCLKTKKGRCASRFLMHQLMGALFQKSIRRESTGTTALGIQRARLEKVVVCVPPMVEQTHIVDVLDTIDDAIRKTEQLIQKLKQMKQGLLHDLLTRGIDENGELRDPERHPEQFTDSPLGRIPRRWQVVHLNTVLSGIDAGWSPACDEIPPSLGEWGVLKVSAVTSGEFLSYESKTLPANCRPRPELEVRDKDILVARANGVADLVGVCAEVRHTPPRLMLSDKVLRLRTNGEILEPSFLGFLLKSPITRRQIESVMSGSSGQKNISQKQIRNLIQPLPAIGEQRQALCILAAATSQIEREQSAANKLCVLKAGLMEDLLTGCVRTTILDGAAA